MAAAAMPVNIDLDHKHTTVTSCWVLSVISIPADGHACTNTRFIPLFIGQGALILSETIRWPRK